jgi:hypothetical protein
MTHEYTPAVWKSKSHECIYQLRSLRWIVISRRHSLVLWVAPSCWTWNLTRQNILCCLTCEYDRKKLVDCNGSDSCPILEVPTFFWGYLRKLVLEWIWIRAVLMLWFWCQTNSIRLGCIAHSCMFVSLVYFICIFPLGLVILTEKSCVPQAIFLPCYINWKIMCSAGDLFCRWCCRYERDSFWLECNWYPTFFCVFLFAV